MRLADVCRILDAEILAVDSLRKQSSDMCFGPLHFSEILGFPRRILCPGSSLSRCWAAIALVAAAARVFFFAIQKLRQGSTSVHAPTVN